MLDVRDAAKTGRQPQTPGALLRELLAHPAVDADVRTPKPVDGLLRVADDEQLPRDGTNASPLTLAGIVGREQQQQFRLEGIRILKLIDEKAGKALLEVTPHVIALAHQIACAQQQIEEVERPVLRLEPLVANDASAQLLAKQRRQIRICVRLELIELLHKC